MIRSKPEWWDYAVTDADGIIIGIQDDAPDEIKEAYRREKAEDKAFWVHKFPHEKRVDEK